MNRLTVCSAMLVLAWSNLANAATTEPGDNAVIDSAKQAQCEEAAKQQGIKTAQDLERFMIGCLRLRGGISYSPQDSSGQEVSSGEREIARQAAEAAKREQAEKYLKK